MRFTTLGVHANYFGTMAEDYDVVIGWISSFIKIPFVNILPLLVVVLGVSFLMILPFDVLKTKKERKDQYEELVALGNMKAQLNSRNRGKSQVLVRSETKASPATPKKVNTETSGGFVSVNKQIQTHKDIDNK